MARGRRERAAPKDEKGGPQFPAERHRRASSHELRYLEPYFKNPTRRGGGEGREKRTSPVIESEKAALTIHGDCG